LVVTGDRSTRGAPPATPTPVTGRQTTFTVYGTPQPQAGTRIVPTRNGPRGITTGGTQLESWRNDMATIAALQHTHLEGPVAVHAIFRFHMTTSARKADRTIGWRHKSTRPDLDKLCRALGDALATSGLINDDAQIVEWDARKIEVHANWSGVWVMVTELTGELSTGSGETDNSVPTKPNENRTPTAIPPEPPLDLPEAALRNNSGLSTLGTSTPPSPLERGEHE
jgi:Holliday junction resolvase RusA-like endonuclease